MPRKAKRMQAPAAPQEQGYGVRGEQIAAQNQMGIPDNTGPSTPPAAPMPTPPLTSGVNPAQLLELMKGEVPPAPGGLARPSERPHEPITTPAAPGPSRAQATTVASTFLMLADLTGDPRYRALAAEAQSTRI